MIVCALLWKIDLEIVFEYYCIFVCFCKVSLKWFAINPSWAKVSAPSKSFGSQANWILKIVRNSLESVIVRIFISIFTIYGFEFSSGNCVKIEHSFHWWPEPFNPQCLKHFFTQKNRHVYSLEESVFNFDVRLILHTKSSGCISIVTIVPDFWLRISTFVRKNDAQNMTTKHWNWLGRKNIWFMAKASESTETSHFRCRYFSCAKIFRGKVARIKWL